MARARRCVAMWLVLAVMLLLPSMAAAEIKLAPGFVEEVYVTGDGFETTTGTPGRGIPSTATLVVDERGTLYLARTGRRYSSGEYEYLARMYRIPAGGARLTPSTEGRYVYGPPLINTQAGASRGTAEILVTTFDRDRRIGAVYRLADGRAVLFAGGTPEDGAPPLLVQPEGSAVEAGGHIFVADRERGAVLRLDAGGRIVDANYVRVTRPRVLAVDDANHLWIASDGSAEAPWQPGPGELWRVAPNGDRRRVLEGPIVQGLAVGPVGGVFVADRQASEIFFVSAEGRRVSLARFSEGSAPRGLAFVPDTPETRTAGLAGDLLVSVIRSGVFQLNEIVRISGPFADLVRP